MSVAWRPSVGLLSAAVVVAGAPSLRALDQPKPKRVCVNRSEINAIRALDDQHALVRLGAGHYYMFTLDKSCHDLHLARAIAISEGAGRVCANGADLLTFELPGEGATRCRIGAIDAVADEEAARELIRSRTAPQ